MGNSWTKCFCSHWYRHLVAFRFLGTSWLNFSDPEVAILAKSLHALIMGMNVIVIWGFWRLLWIVCFPGWNDCTALHSFQLDDFLAQAFKPQFSAMLIRALESHSRSLVKPFLGRHFKLGHTGCSSRKRSRTHIQTPPLEWIKHQASGMIFQSHDLSSIENLWTMLTNQVCAVKPTNLMNSAKMPGRKIKYTSIIKSETCWWLQKMSCQCATS